MPNEKKPTRRDRATRPTSSEKSDVVGPADGLRDRTQEVFAGIIRFYKSKQLGVLIIWIAKLLHFNPRIDLDSVIQNVMLSAVRRAYSFKGQVNDAAISKWIYSLAKFEVRHVNENRKQFKAESIGGYEETLFSSIFSGSDLVMSTENNELLMMAVDILDYDNKRFFLMAANEGLKEAEVVFDLSKEAARKKWNRLCMQLRGELVRLGYEPPKKRSKKPPKEQP
jgi:hypothetical protein